MAAVRRERAEDQTNNINGPQQNNQQQDVVEREDGQQIVKNSPYGAARAKLGWGDLFAKPVVCFNAAFPNVRIGISSLNGVASTGKREMVELIKLYRRKFTCLEHCQTYHAMGDVANWHKWKEYAPAGFQYTIKANQFLTHAKQLKVDDDTTQHINNFFRDRCMILQDAGKLGAVLIQLPPTFTASGTNLKNLQECGKLISEVAPAINIVVEFRHASWFCDSTYDTLVQLRWGIVAVHNHDTGDSPVVDRVNLAAGKGKGLFYARLHGSVKQFMGDYGRDKMKLWAHKMRAFLEQSGPEGQAFCFLNNNESHINSLTSSVVDATALAEEIFAMPIKYAAAAAAAENK